MKNIATVQIFPMSPSLFPDDRRDLESIQSDYLLRELPFDQEGRFYYQISGISRTEDNLILFCLHTQIIGSGILMGKGEDKNGNYLLFDTNSISIYNKPINETEMANIWKDYKDQNRVKKILDVKQLDKFINRFANRKISYISDEKLFQIQVEEASPTKLDITDKPITKSGKKISMISCYPRDPKISKRVLINAKYNCEYNQEHKYFISSSTKNNYVEAHHLIPLNYQGKYGNSLDVDANVVSLCPICHKLIHFSVLKDKIDVIKHLFSLRSKRLKKAGILISEEELIEFYK